MARAHQYPRLILAVVCLPVFIGALDLTIVSAVLPEVIRSMTVEIQKLDVAGWVVTGYFVSYAISMTFMGRVSDISGRRVVFLGCLVIFFVGSWLVAASPGWPARVASSVIAVFEGKGPEPAFAPLYALIFGRVVQAFGAGAMVPVSMALVADLFPPEKRALPLGIVGAVDTSGWVLGHLYGGIMVQFMTWPYLFWINLPIIAVMFAVTWWGLAGLPRVDVKGGIDWIGVMLLGIALVLLNLGLGSPEIATDVSTNPPQHQIYWVVGAVVVFVIFLMSQRWIKEPILNLSIFSNRNVSAATGVNLLVGFCIMVALVSVPIFINVAGSSQDTKKAALVTGYLLCAFTVPMAVAAIPGGWLSSRFGYRWSVICGLAVAVLGFLTMSLWKVQMARQAVAFFEAPGGPARADVVGTAFMAAGLALAGIGIGLTIAPIGTAVVNGVRDQERGMAASLVIIVRLIGMSISMSSMTAYGLRRTTILGRELLRPEDAMDLEKTAQVALEAVTRVTSEISLIALAVAATATAVALLLRKADVPLASVTSQTSTMP
jgi:MFS transporter, DHA2 family, triacylglyceride efflux pump